MVELSGSKPSGMMEIIRNEETGEISGVTLPSGKSFVGLSPRDIRNLIKAQQGKEAELGGTVEARDVAAAREQDIRAQELAQVPIETARNIPIGEQTLAPRISNLNKVPILGENVDESQQAATARATIRKLKKSGLSNQEILAMSSDPNVAALNLNEIDLEVIASGEADVSKIQQMVEATPIIPRDIKKWVSSVVSPSKQTQQIKETLEKTKDNILAWSDLAKSNPRFASRYLKLIQDAEHEILRMESKIKLITLQSPDLQANPEEVNFMQVTITGIKTSVQAKREELILLGIR